MLKFLYQLLMVIILGFIAYMLYNTIVSGSNDPCDIFTDSEAQDIAANIFNIRQRVSIELRDFSETEITKLKSMLNELEKWGYDYIDDLGFGEAVKLEN